MDEPLTSTPVLSGELKALVDKAEKTYWDHFNGDAWIGRCIFLSFYCSINTCDFCFRSVADKNKQDPEKSMRSFGSILTEALLIKAFHWRIEFLTGGYGIAPPDVIARYVVLVKKVLGEKIWLNLGVMPPSQLSSLKDSVGGVVASLETLEPVLHQKVCPDKPIAPYLRMLDHAQSLGMKRSITLVIGLGETRDHWHYLEEFLSSYPLDRITLYALRPVKGTPYVHGPSPEEVAWWIAMIRTHFPRLEIIAGTAEYRIPEISLLLRAGANALTKLPVTKMFNTEQSRLVEEEVRKAGRRLTSVLSHPDPLRAAPWDEMIDGLDLSVEEAGKLRETLHRYLRMMSRSHV